MLALPVLTALCQLASPSVLPDSVLRPGGVEVADLNGDGHLDLLVVDSVQTRVLLALGGPSGELGPLAPLFQLGSPLIGNSLYGVSVSDVDGDVANDVILTTGSSGEVWIAYGDGEYAQLDPVRVGTATGRVRSVEFADINGDGLRDLVAATYDDFRSCYFLGETGGGFSTRRNLVAGDALEADSIRLIDVDLDGDLDVLAADARLTGATDAGSLLLFENTSGFPLRATDVSTVMPGGMRMDVQDSDGNGNPEVVVAAAPNFSASTLHLFQVASGGLMGPSSIGSTIPRVEHVALEDADGDGDRDVLVLTSSSSNGEVILATNGGAGLFTFEGVVTQFGSSFAFDFGDLTGDGLADLV
ncbi:MAG: VCBS repeat-containing protein, partial [Planctomycetota bacterium]